MLTEQKAEDGTVVFALPFQSVDSKVPSFDVERDFGPVVKGIFDAGKNADGKMYSIIAEWLEVPHRLSPKIDV
jgi:hypothetical protein